MNLHVRVKAGSKMNQLWRDTEGKWVLKIKAPPVDGKANEEVVRFLSEILRVPKLQIDIIAGHTNPHKKIEVATLNEEEALQRLNEFIRQKS